MKSQIEALLKATVEGLKAEGGLPADVVVSIEVDHTRSKEHGDFATNGALTLAKAARAKPREVAEKIVKALPASPLIAKVEIAGPGFINFFLKDGAYQQIVTRILKEGEHYGRSTLGAGQRVQVEFVSANPTGPLHVGHGRGAAYGACVADLLAAAGFNVHRE